MDHLPSLSFLEIEMIRSFPASNEGFRKSENPADSSPASDQMTLCTKKD